MAQVNRRQVSLRIETWRKATDLRDSLAEVSGRKVSIADTIHRGLECLADAHARGAWLSPKEAAPVLEQRLRSQLASALAQFVGRAMPDKTLSGIVFHPPGHTLTVILEGDVRVPLLVAPTEAPRSRQAQSSVEDGAGDTP